MKKLSWSEERNLIITLECDDCEKEIREKLGLKENINETELFEEEVEFFVKNGYLDKDILEEIKTDYQQIFLVF